MEQELEQARKKALSKVLLCYSITVIIGISIMLSIRSLGIGFGFIIIGIFIDHFITRKDIQNFNTLYKQNIVVMSMEKICTDVKFDMQKGIDRQVIASTNMMNMGDIFSSNDYVTGKYKNINFEMSDVEIQEESTDSEGHTTYYTIFKGQWYIFDFNKTFKANIQVCASNFHNARRGSLFAKKEERFKKVELEDIEFNKEFKVYAQNELDAFYVLTPGTMTKIKEVKSKIKGRLLFCFIDDRLHVALHNNKDFFEASIFKKVNVEKAIEKTNEEISAITNFVDILSLDNDLFKMN